MNHVNAYDIRNSSPRRLP